MRKGGWDGPPVYVVAPAAATLAAERAILQQAGQAGSARLRVATVGRLSQALLGAMGRPVPDVVPPGLLRAAVRAVAAQGDILQKLGAADLSVAGVEGRLAESLLELFWHSPDLPAAARAALGDQLFAVLQAARSGLLAHLDAMAALPEPLLLWRCAAALATSPAPTGSVIWAELPGPPAREALREALAQAGLLRSAAPAVPTAPRPGAVVSAALSADPEVEARRAALRCRTLLAAGALPEEIAIGLADFRSQRKETLRALGEARIPADGGSAPIEGESLWELLGGLFELAGGEEGQRGSLRVVSSGLSPLPGALRDDLLRHLRDREPPRAAGREWLSALRAAAAAWPERSSLPAHLGYLEEWLKGLGLPEGLSTQSEQAARQVAIWNGFWEGAAQLATGLGAQGLARATALRILGDLLRAAAPHVPPQRGAVRVLPLAALAGAEYPHVLLLGLSEGHFPAARRVAGIVPPELLERAERAGAPIAVPPAQVRGRALEAANAAVYAATLSLYLSCALRSADDKPQAPALRLLELGPPRGGLAEAEPLLERALSREDAGIALAEEIGRRRDIGADPSPFLPLAAAHLQVAGPGPHFRGFLPRRREQPVGPPGSEIAVTALERRAACAFQSFARDVLRLEPAEAPGEFDPRERGTLVHTVLASLPMEPPSGPGERLGLLQALVGQAADELALLPPADARAAVMRRQLAQELLRTAEMLWQEAACSAFRPVGREVGFGSAGPLPALRLPLPGGAVALVRGRIDRVDMAEEYLRLVDYKVHQHQEFNLTRVYHGLDLQIGAYGLAVERSGAYLPARVAALVYWPIRLGQSWQGDEEEALPEQGWRAQRPRGLYLGISALLPVLDRAAPGGGSPFHPLAVKKDGGLRKSPSALAPLRWSRLQDRLATRLGELGAAAQLGTADLDPYRLGPNDTACRRCAFGALCRHIPERDGYRRLRVVEEEVLDDADAPDA